jgi:serine/threonine protein kinase
LCTICGGIEQHPGRCGNDANTLRQVFDNEMLGAKLGNFVIVEYVAGGGMGEVFRAVQPALGATVAIKVMPASIAQDERMAKRMIVEAQACNRVAHDGVVKVTDAGVYDGRPYFVMEFLAGETLAAALGHGEALATTLVCRIVDDILAVLEAAHTARVIHRDLKPNNIFLTKTGRVKVLDFGLARMLDHKTRLTHHGSMLGTPQYMAPEQVSGTDVDHRADLYAVGVMLFEMLTQQHPFDTSSEFTVLDGHLNTRAPSLASFGVVASPLLESFVAKALAKKPAARFQSAGDMRSALRSAALVAGPLQVSTLTLQPWALASWDAHAHLTGEAGPTAVLKGAGISTRIESARGRDISPKEGMPLVNADSARRRMPTAIIIGCVMLSFATAALTLNLLRTDSVTSSVTPSDKAAPVVPYQVPIELSDAAPGEKTRPVVHPPDSNFAPASSTPPVVVEKPADSKPPLVKPGKPKVIPTKPVGKPSAELGEFSGESQPNTATVSAEVVCSTVGGHWAHCRHATCDVNLSFDDANCGACGNRCKPTASCVNSVCRDN